MRTRVKKFVLGAFLLLLLLLVIDYWDYIRLIFFICWQTIKYFKVYYLYANYGDRALLRLYLVIVLLLFVLLIRRIYKR